MKSGGAAPFATRRRSRATPERKHVNRALVCIAALGLCICARPDSNSERPPPRRDPSPTCEQRAQAVETLFATYNRCKQASDCQLVWPQCPFACYRAIERSRMDEVFRKINEYQRHCPRCQYRCTLLESKEALCENGICQVPKR